MKMNDTSDLESRVVALEAAVILLNEEINDVEDINVLQGETLNAMEERLNSQDDRLNSQDNRLNLMESDISVNEDDIGGERKLFFLAMNFHLFRRTRDKLFNWFKNLKMIHLYNLNTWKEQFLTS